MYNLNITYLVQIGLRENNRLLQLPMLRIITKELHLKDLLLLLVKPANTVQFYDLGDLQI